MKKLIVLTLVVASIILCASCGMSERIVGTWKAQSTVFGVVVETTFVFNEDGTGSTGTVGDIAVPMTYSLKGDTLTITSTLFGIEMPMEYTASFDGDKLILTSEDETLTFTKTE